MTLFKSFSDGNEGRIKRLMLIIFYISSEKIFKSIIDSINFTTKKTVNALLVDSGVH
jgi:hypothetical protein